MLVTSPSFEVVYPATMVPPSEVALITKGTSVAEPPYLRAQWSGGNWEDAESVGASSKAIQAKKDRIMQLQFNNGRISDS